MLTCDEEIRRRFSSCYGATLYRRWNHFTDKLIEVHPLGARPGILLKVFQIGGFRVAAPWP